MFFFQRLIDPLLKKARPNQHNHLDLNKATTKFPFLPISFYLGPLLLLQHHDASFQQAHGAALLSKSIFSGDNRIFPADTNQLIRGAGDTV